MEPVSGAPGTAPPSVILPPDPARLPKYVLVGLSLAALGVLFSGVSYAWDYLGLRTSFGATIVTYIQVEITLTVIEELCTELGLFFIFLGVLRLLPSVPPWSRVGALLILIGAIMIAVIDLTEAALAALTYPPAALRMPDWSLYSLVVALVAGVVTAGLGLLVSLFAVAKGVVLRSVTAPSGPRA